MFVGYGDYVIIDRVMFIFIVTLSVVATISITVLVMKWRNKK